MKKSIIVLLTFAFTSSFAFASYEKLEYKARFKSLETGAYGEFSLEEKNNGALKYEFEVKNIQNLTKAHIHLGERGENGPAIFTIVSGINKSAHEFEKEGFISDKDLIVKDGFNGTVADLIRIIKEGKAYVNVHTEKYPSGEMRDQIIVWDEDREMSDDRYEYSTNHEYYNDENEQEHKDKMKMQAQHSYDIRDNKNKHDDNDMDDRYLESDNNSVNNMQNVEDKVQLLRSLQAQLLQLLQQLLQQLSALKQN